VDLSHQEFLDFHNPLHRSSGSSQAVLAEQRNRGVEFVKNLFEPEFVCLVDRDEEQFVVVRWTRAAILQVDEIRDA
jgi:hypothetical protein